MPCWASERASASWAEHPFSRPHSGWSESSVDLFQLAWDRPQLDTMLVQAFRLEREIEERNRPLSDEELDAMLPSEGYKVLEPPAG